MKKGYSLIEVLIGLILSFFVLQLLLAGFKYINIDRHDYSSQDLISSFQLHQILNSSTDIEVSENEVSFSYFNEERSLSLINNKLILKPGTVIYFLKVDECKFYIEDEKIYIKIIRKSGESVFLIGII